MYYMVFLNSSCMTAVIFSLLRGRLSVASHILVIALSLFIIIAMVRKLGFLALLLSTVMGAADIYTTFFSLSGEIDLGSFFASETNRFMAKISLGSSPIGLLSSLLSFRLVMVLCTFGAIKEYVEIRRVAGKANWAVLSQEDYWDIKQWLKATERLNFLWIFRSIHKPSPMDDLEIPDISDANLCKARWLRCVSAIAWMFAWLLMPINNMIAKRQENVALANALLAGIFVLLLLGLFAPWIIMLTIRKLRRFQG